MLDKSENLEIGFEIQCYKCEKIGFTSNANGWTYEIVDEIAYYICDDCSHYHFDF
jgi:hypothetical protein